MLTAGGCRILFFLDVLCPRTSLSGLGSYAPQLSDGEYPPMTLIGILSSMAIAVARKNIRLASGMDVRDRKRWDGAHNARPRASHPALHHDRALI